ncbi:MAG TPA: GDP-fucose synthetase [Proteobacteria bacterium]|nr:GDP-fucose synthetase [Pseudomonadota bacterium]
MNKNIKIYIAGHRGLAGSAIVRELQRLGYTNLVTRTHAELNLEDAAATLAFFEQEKPELVFLAATRVGGIHANNTYPVDFLMSNLLIEANICRAAHATDVARLIFLGSSCIYPRDCPQPIREEYLLTGPLETTNSAYAVAKIAGIEMARAYRRQYGDRFIAVMPTNLYGPGDNYDLQTSHVLPALIRKLVEAKQAGAPTMTVWGTGRPRREFLHADDLADACLFLLEHYDGDQILNIGTGRDCTIAELAAMVAAAVGYTGELVFDPTQPDGTPQKLLDVRRLTALGWQAKISLCDGINRTVAEYLEQGGG